ncbi:MAG: hypothetical protein KME64_37570 [Scytonematopsis contorta HA4267-MV1]|jgi:hypothetical protein|nr:hypothetical protein [Scytonematopsis contorta HA4267-MV1]
MPKNGMGYDKWWHFGNALWIIFGLTWRTGLGLFGFVVYASLGYKYDWPFYMPIAILCGFAPWGWKVKGMLAEEASDRFARKMEQAAREGNFYFHQKIEIRQTPRIAIFIVDVFDKIIWSGILGIVLGWKAVYREVAQLIYDIQNLFA